MNSKKDPTSPLTPHQKCFKVMCEKCKEVYYTSYHNNGPIMSAEEVEHICVSDFLVWSEDFGHVKNSARSITAYSPKEAAKMFFEAENLYMPENDTCEINVADMTGKTYTVSIETVHYYEYQLLE